jgi:hypothetical protein
MRSVSQTNPSGIAFAMDVLDGNQSRMGIPHLFKPLRPLRFVTPGQFRQMPNLASQDIEAIIA